MKFYLVCDINGQPTQYLREFAFSMQAQNYTNWQVDFLFDAQTDSENLRFIREVSLLDRRFQLFLMTQYAGVDKYASRCDSAYARINPVNTLQSYALHDMLEFFYAHPQCSRLWVNSRAMYPANAHNHIICRYQHYEVMAKEQAFVDQHIDNMSDLLVYRSDDQAGITGVLAIPVYLIRGQKTEDRRQRTEDRGQRTEDREQRTEDRGQRTEDRGQRSEVRGQRSEVRGQRCKVPGSM